LDGYRLYPTIIAEADRFLLASHFHSLSAHQLFLELFLRNWDGSKRQ
jgi:hypothetical protein